MIENQISVSIQPQGEVTELPQTLSEWLVHETPDLRIDDKRERMVLKEIEKYIQDRPAEDSREIILIYGKGHDFKKYFDRIKNENIQFDQVQLQQDGDRQL